jgi:hypothetical protein
MLVIVISIFDDSIIRIVQKLYMDFRLTNNNFVNFWQLCQVQFGGEDDAPPTSHHVRRSAGDRISLAQLQHILLEDYGERLLHVLITVS